MGDNYYIIDTCSLTKLRRDYPIEVFPSVWDFVSDLVDSQIVESIELVYDELAVQATDAVTEWADEHKTMFLPLTEEIQQRAVEILRDFPNSFIDLKKRKSGADPFIVAAAQVYDYSIITEEKKSGGPQKVKIPDVCDFYELECINLIQLLQREGLSL